MKREIIENVKITGFEFPKNGVANFSGGRVLVKGALPGQELKISIYRKKKVYFGRVLEILAGPTGEDAPHCEKSGICGGCTFGSVSYGREIEIKKSMLESILEEGEIELVPSESPCRYRNKMEYSFGDQGIGGLLELGFRKPGARYEVVNAEPCSTAPKDFSKILAAVLEFFRETGDSFYNRIKKEGCLRHLVLREGFFTKEILVNLVTTSDLSADLNELSARLLSLPLDGKIVGFLHTENDSVADAVIPQKVNTIHGRDYFYENLCGLQFKISAFSFFQTNSKGAESLYETVLEFAGDQEGQALDLYCGTGTIAQLLSQKAKTVIGVEIVAEAVSAAEENAGLNNIKNCQFICGDVAKVVKSLPEEPALIILDPPREGINPKALGDIVNFNAAKIIYVSCKPTSLKRDLEFFTQNGYKVEKLRAHDMFPRTYHVETVVLLKRE